MTNRLTLGGRISIGLCLFWAINVFELMRRGPLSQYCESIAVWMTFPLGAINGIGSIFWIRGVMGLDEVMTAYVLMIPNVFLLGYGITSYFRVMRFCHRYFHPTSPKSAESLQNQE